jgi:hypothetical protein
MATKGVRKQLIPKALMNFLVQKSAEEHEREEVRGKALDPGGLR